MVVQNILLKRKRRAAKRLERMKEERRRRQAFLRRQAMERMFLVLMTVSCCNLSPEKTKREVAVCGSML